MSQAGIPAPPSPPEDPTSEDETSPACALVFNASDPSGAAGLAADCVTMASVGAHALPIVCGAYVRDTAEVFDHVAFDSETVTEQGRAVLEDMQVQVFKVGFVGSPENLAAVAELASDYADIPMVTYMPDLSWWDMERIEAYLDACQELVLPQTTVLVGNHSTLRRWLLPDWTGDKPPTARDIARAAGQCGVAYVLVTGTAHADQHLENTLASPQAVLMTERYERFDATFTGAGDTLSAALSALLATGCELAEAAAEALGYLDRALAEGFRPGMGHIVPDRMFWAQSEAADSSEAAEAGGAPSSAAAASTGSADLLSGPLASSITLPGNDTQH